MAIFGKNGFIRKQEIAFAKKLLASQYKTSGAALPDEAAISTYAEKIVDEAHRIAQKSGSSVLEILKTRIREIKKSLNK
jgi:hypothetical protein